MSGREQHAGGVPARRTVIEIARGQIDAGMA